MPYPYINAVPTHHPSIPQYSPNVVTATCATKYITHHYHYNKRLYQNLEGNIWIATIEEA